MSAVAGMIIILLGVSVFTPALIVNTQEAQTNSQTQTLNGRTTVTGDVESYVVNVDSNQKEANITVVNKRTGEVNSTGSIGEGEYANLTFTNGYVNVSMIDVLSSDRVTVNYGYPLFLGWPDGSSVIISNTPLLMLLGIVMLLVGVLMVVMREAL